VTYKPNGRIVDRAVELWMGFLSDPQYENGDRGQASVMAGQMAQMTPKNNTPDKLRRFADELRVLLMNPGAENGLSEYDAMILHSDYGPSVALEMAALRSGLKMLFPWKTSLCIYEDHLSVRAGYGADHVFHYPLKDGRWLVARLEGEDVAKVVALVEAGVITPELEPGKVH